MPFHPIALRGQPLAAGQLPAICAPLVGRTVEALLAEVALIVPQRPDLLEWRVDFFASLADTDAVLAAARAVRVASGALPVLFTRRSLREGGQPITRSEAEVAALYLAVAASGCVDLLDWEMESEPALLAQVREAARRHQLPLVLSFHNFHATPTNEALAAKFEQAQRLGADIAKLAVMPNNLDDVLRLLAATAAAGERLGLPVVSMAMGPLGASTRLCGGAFGSALSFAVGASASAPGQLPIAEVRQAVGALQRAMAPVSAG